jgi:hypothetical protein
MEAVQLDNRLAGYRGHTQRVLEFEKTLSSLVDFRMSHQKPTSRDGPVPQ